MIPTLFIKDNMNSNINNVSLEDGHNEWSFPELPI